MTMRLRDIASFWIVSLIPSIFSGKLSEYFYIQQHLLEALNNSSRHLGTSNGYKRQHTLPYGSRDLDLYIPFDINLLQNKIFSQKLWSTENIASWYKFDSVPHIADSQYFHSVQQNPSYNIPEIISNSPVIYFNQPNAKSVIYKQSIPSTSSDLYNTVFQQTDKRHMTEKYKAQIEVLLVVDNSIFRNYLRANSYSETAAKEKIKKYFSILFAMVDQRFSTISDHTLSVGVYVCDLIIAETRRDAAWIEYLARWSSVRNNGVVNASKALRRFQKWLKVAPNLPRYDHAIIITSYILSKRKRPVEGLAYVGTMCKVSSGKSASVVQDVGDFQSASVIAHELGHSLGVSHDGEGEGKLCPANSNFVMAPINFDEQWTASNIYHFSKCSVQQMKKMIKSRQGSCLSNRPRVSLSHNLWTDPPGRRYDEDMQCKMAFGQSFQFCDQGSSRSSMCERLWCISPEENALTCRTNTRLMALPGTPCGYDKHCHLGKCVHKINNRLTPMLHSAYERLKFRDPNCLGDGNPAYCSVIIRASPYLCQRPNLKKYCCESCAKNGNNGIET